MLLETFVCYIDRKIIIQICPPSAKMEKEKNSLTTEIPNLFTLVNGLPTNVGIPKYVSQSLIAGVFWYSQICFSFRAILKISMV